MWFWDGIANTIKNWVKVLQDAGKTTDWPLATDGRVDDTLSQWEEILKQAKQEQPKPEEKFVWVKAEPIVKKQNIPEKQVEPVIKENKQPEPNKNLETDRTLVDKWIDFLTNKAWEAVSSVVDDVSQLWERAINKWQNFVNEYRISNIKKDLDKNMFNDLNNIEWLDIPDIVWWVMSNAYWTQNLLSMWQDSWVDKIANDIANYTYDMKELNYNTEKELDKLKTKEEYNKYIQDKYIPAVDAINIKHFKNYTKSWQWLTQEQISNISNVVNKYWKKVQVSTLSLLPAKAIEQQKFQRLNDEVAQKNIYLTAYKKLWGKYIDDPFILMQANKVNQQTAQELMQIENIPNLSTVEREQAKDEIVKLRTVGATALAMMDVWKSDEEIAKYLEDQWYSKRSVLNKKISKKDLVGVAKSIMWVLPTDVTSLLWDTDSEIDKIYDKYDKISLDRFKVESVWDLYNYASEKYWQRYSKKIEPYFDLLNNAKSWALAEHWMYDLDWIAKWTDSYKWNKAVDTIKKWTEVAANAAAVILSEWALSWLWEWVAMRLWATKAWQVATAEWLSSVLIKWATQDFMVEWALKANFPTMQIENKDAKIDVVMNLGWAIFDAANSLQKVQATNSSFNRLVWTMPGVDILTKDLNLSLKEKTALVDSRPAVERTIRWLNSVNPELTSQMIKDSILKKQLYKYIKSNIVPLWSDLLAKHWGDEEKAFSEFRKAQDAAFDMWEKKVKDVADSDVSILEFLWEDNKIVNSAHDAPKASDITKWKPKLVWDSVEDALNYFSPTRPNQTTKSSLSDILKITPSDDITTIENKIAEVFKTDPKWSEKISKAVMHKNTNGVTTFFNDWKPNDKFFVLANFKWADFDNIYNRLANEDLWLAIRNITNNWYELVGEMSYDKIQYRKATDSEKENPDIPTFKVDWDMLVPMKPTEEDMVKWKKVWGRASNMSVTSDDVETVSLDWKSYVKNPIKLNKVVKSDVKYTKKVDTQEAQSIYLDYADKVSNKKDDITFIDDNDLYVKLYKNLDSNTSFDWHAKTSALLDYVLRQNDTTKLLEVVKWFNWTSLKRFTNYITSLDDSARAQYIAKYDWPYKDVVKWLVANNKFWENIASKNMLAEMLVNNWRFNNKATAYKYVNDNYEQLVTNAVSNKEISDKEYLFRTLPSRTMKFLKLDWRITNPLWELFMYNSFSDDVIKQINKLADEYNIVRRFDLPKDTAWYIDHNLKEIAINWLFVREDDIFAHEFGHRLNQMFSDETNKIINKLFLKDQKKAVKALMKKYPWLDEAWALERMQDHRVFTDKNHNWYIWPDHYQAMNQSERVAENVRKYMSWDTRSIPKEVRSIFKQIVDWINELYKKILWVKKTWDEFREIMNNLWKHIDEKKAKLNEAWIEYMKSNINFYDKEWNIVFDTPKKKDPTSLAKELESWILEYIANNDWLDLKFLENVENIIDIRTKPWTAEEKAARKVLYKYSNHYYNWNNRSLLDVWEGVLWLNNIKPNKVDVTHEFLLSASKFKDIVEKNWFNKDSFNIKIKSIIEDESKKYMKNHYISDMTKENLNNAIDKAINNFNLYIQKQAEKTWSVSPEKVNRVLDVVANTNFSVPWKIYNFNFIPEKSWNTPLSHEIFSNAYKKRELIVPLPWDVINVDKKLKDFNVNNDKKWPIEQKIEFIINSVPEEWKSYVFADYNTIKHWDEFVSKYDNVPDITLIKPEMNMISMRIEDWALKLWSYNDNAFEWLKDTVKSIMPVKQDVFISDTAKEISNEIPLENQISEYFNDIWLEELPDGAYKYMYQTPSYLINLVNSRKSILNKYSNYQFIDMNVIKRDLIWRNILSQAKWISIDDILNSVSPSEYKISKWFLETINSYYWFDLIDSTRFNSDKYELISRLATRSYVSANHADMMMAQLKLLKQFMKPTAENKKLFSDLITPLFHRNIMKWLDMNNQAIRWTVKNLVFNDLMESDLPDAISSYVMRADEVMDYLIDNADDVKKMADDLMRYEWNQNDVRPLANFTVPSQLSVYLKNFYDRNRRELVTWFNNKTGRDESTLAPEYEPWTNDLIVGDNIFERSTTAKQWLVLTFLNDILQNVMEDTKRVADATNFHLYDPLSKWYYLKDNNIESFINWLWDITLDWVIKKQNFPKLLNTKTNDIPKLLNKTESLLADTSKELVNFYDSSIKAWEKISWKEYAPYFFKKEEIDNMFGEVYVKTRDYMNFLEHNFWWTKSLNKILADIKASTYSLDRFSKVTSETLDLYKNTLNKITDAIKEWQDAIIKELESMSNWFDITRLIRSGKTGKLSLGVWPDWKQLLITDWYDLNDFIKEEAEYLWYKAPDWFYQSASTSEKQVKLIWMYTDALQNIIDKEAVWHLDKAKIAEFFFRNSSIKNPFWWKEPLYLWEDSRINKYAREFWNTVNHVPRFSVYTLLNKDTKMAGDWFKFFKDQWIKFDYTDNVVNALDLTIKNNLTHITEWYVRSKKYIWRVRRNDMKKIVVESIFKWLYDMFDQNFLMTFSKFINSDNKFIVDYVDKALDYMDTIHMSRVWLKELKTQEMLWYLQKTNVDFQYIAKRLWSMMEALKPFAWNEAYNMLLKSNLWLNIKWHQISLANAITNKSDKELLAIQLSKTSDHIAQQQLATQIEYNLDTFGRSEEELNEASQDMVSIEKKALDYVYWFDEKPKMEYDPFEFAKKAKENLLEKVSLDNRMRMYSSNEYLDYVLNNKRWVSKYVNPDWTVWWTANLKSPYYTPRVDEWFIRDVIEENWDLFRSVEHPKFAEQQAKEMEDAIKFSDEVMWDIKDLFSNCNNK